MSIPGKYDKPEGFLRQVAGTHAEIVNRESWNPAWNANAAGNVLSQMNR